MNAAEMEFDMLKNCYFKAFALSTSRDEAYTW